MPTDTWVIGMIDEDGYLRLEIIPDKKSDSLILIIQRNVEAGSEIHTDGLPSYRGLAQLGYSHMWVNHKKRFVASDGTHTQRIESQWRALRRRFGRAGYRQGNIGDNLIEYLLRRECKREGLDVFGQLVNQTKPI